MKTRITARWLIQEGYNEIGDREIDNDKYANVEVRSIEEGRVMIEQKDLHGNGCGRIVEEREGKCGWEELAVHDVCSGVIFNSESMRS